MAADNALSSIQIISDTHLEFGGVYEKMEKEDRFPKGGAPILALLGDIGYPQKETYWKFIDQIIDRFKYILIITGNHEYYQNEYHAANQLIKDKIANNSLYTQKVKFLNNECLELSDILPNIRILGTTLWVNYPDADEDEKIAIQYEYKINDFRRIRYLDPNSDEEKMDKIPLLTSVNVNKLHKECVNFLEFEMERAKKDDKKVIILSHHAPTNFECIHPETDYKSDALAYGMNYASMEYLFKEPLVGWFFGHTHFNLDILLRRSTDDWTIRIASNQQGYIMGYHKDKAPMDYSDQKVIVFPNEDKRNKDVKVVQYDEFEKLLVDKQKLIPNADFFQKQIKQKIETNSHDQESKSFCILL